MCSSAHRRPGDRRAKHRCPPASPESARDVQRTSCKRGCEDGDLRSFSIPPCCPAFGQEIRVADQKTRQDERDRCCVSPEPATRVRVLMKPMPDEAALRCARRAVSSAKLGPDNRVEVQRAPWLFYHNAEIPASCSGACVKHQSM